MPVRAADFVRRYTFPFFSLFWVLGLCIEGRTRHMCTWSVSVAGFGRKQVLHQQETCDEGVRLAKPSMQPTILNIAHPF